MVKFEEAGETLHNIVVRTLVPNQAWILGWKRGRQPFKCSQMSACPPDSR